MKAYKNMHATVIQRYMRGYRVNQQILTKIRKEKLSINQKFFDEMKKVL